jgi:hypothetical protein
MVVTDGTNTVRHLLGGGAEAAYEARLFAEAELDDDYDDDDDFDDGDDEETTS